MSILELARIAGVSKATVSRVLNNYPRVAPETIEAVRRAAETLGYEKPKSRVGRPRRTPAGTVKGVISFIFPDTDPASIRTVLSGRLLHGAEDIIRNRRLNLHLSGLVAPGRLPSNIETRQVDGVLMRGLPSDLRQVGMIIEAIGKLPCVHVFEPRYPVPPTWDIVLEDNELIGSIAANYLIGRGGKKIAIVYSEPDHPSLKHRMRSFRATAEDAGVSIVVVADKAPHTTLVAQLLETTHGKVDGVFVPGSDQAVVDAYRAFTARGIKVLEDIEFISCNNNAQQLSILDPRLANIDIQAEAIGRAAAEMLLERLRKPSEPRKRIAVAPQLVEAKPTAESP